MKNSFTDNHSNSKHSFYRSLFLPVQNLRDLLERDVLIACMLSNNPKEMRELLAFKTGREIHPSSITHYFSRKRRQTNYMQIRRFQLTVIECSEVYLSGVSHFEFNGV